MHMHMHTHIHTVRERIIMQQQPSLELSFAKLTHGTYEFTRHTTVETKRVCTKTTMHPPIEYWSSSSSPIEEIYNNFAPS